jgi:hypothetical protein
MTQYKRVTNKIREHELAIKELKKTARKLVIELGGGSLADPAFSAAPVSAPAMDMHAHAATETVKPMWLLVMSFLMANPRGPGFTVDEIAAGLGLGRAPAPVEFEVKRLLNVGQLLGSGKGKGARYRVKT